MGCSRRQLLSAVGAGSLSVGLSGCLGKSQASSIETLNPPEIPNINPTHFTVQTEESTTTNLKISFLRYQHLTGVPPGKIKLTVYKREWDTKEPIEKAEAISKVKQETLPVIKRNESHEEEFKFSNEGENPYFELYATFSNGEQFFIHETKPEQRVSIDIPTASVYQPVENNIGERFVRNIQDGTIHSTIIWNPELQKYKTKFGVGMSKYYETVRHSSTLKDTFNHYTNSESVQLILKAIRNSYSTISSPVMSEELSSIVTLKHSLEDNEIAQSVIKFVQGFPYLLDTKAYERIEYLVEPTQLICTLIGDCEDRSLLMATLLAELGYNPKMLIYPNHVVVAVQQDKLDNVFETKLKSKHTTEISGEKYIPIEPNNPTKPGKLKEGDEPIGAVISPNSRKINIENSLKFISELEYSPE